MKKGTISVLATAMGALGSYAIMKKTKGHELKDSYVLVDKNESIIQLFNRWLSLKQEGKSLDLYFMENGYKSIAIYGMSYVGERLYNELKNSSIEIKYGIDHNAGSIDSEIEIKHPDEEMQAVDAVVVTAIYYFEEIEYGLSEKFNCPIISLEDVLYDL